MKRLTVNGKNADIDADASTPLLWVLRDHLGLTGTKYSCGIGACGACTVHIAGKPVQACVTEIRNVDGPVTTIEGVSTDRADGPAWVNWMLFRRLLPVRMNWRNRPAESSPRRRMPKSTRRCARRYAAAGPSESGRPLRKLRAL
jgi:succinate dehydrogenase/fumarate reductase-like Fe-S protein